MKTLKKIIGGGLLVLLINFCVVNILTLYYVNTDTSKNVNLELYNYSLFTMDTTPDGFGYVFTYEGMLASLLLGGILGLLCRFVCSKKTA